MGEVRHIGFPCGSAGKESTWNAGDPGSIPGSGRSAGEGIGYPLLCSWASLVAQVKNPHCSVGDLGSIPGLGRSLGEGMGYPLQYSSLENSVDCIVHGVTKSWTRLRDSHFTWMMLMNTDLARALWERNSEWRMGSLML